MKNKKTVYMILLVIISFSCLKANKIEISSIDFFVLHLAIHMMMF